MINSLPLSQNNLFGAPNILDQFLINAVKLDDFFLIITAQRVKTESTCSSAWF